MVQQLYERPRERIRTRGVASLSTAELLQVIIGSGSKNYTVAKLAKNVSEVLVSNISANLYDTLCKIPGIGDATACKIIAALQLKVASRKVSHYLQKNDIHKFANHKNQKIHCLALDSKQNTLGTYTWAVKERKTTNLIAKQLYSKALSDGARSLAVIIGCQKQSLTPGTFELNILNDLKELAVVMQIPLRALILVNKTDATYLYGGSNEHESS